MSEKLQHTTAFVRKKMAHRYPDEDQPHGKQPMQHKHNKLRQSFRQHCRTHPVPVNVCEEENVATNEPTGFIRTQNLRKIFTRERERRYH